MWHATIGERPSPVSELISAARTAPRRVASDDQ
jgi:hypothetical protein